MKINNKKIAFSAYGGFGNKLMQFSKWCGVYTSPHQKRGMSLFEILVATLVFTLALGALLGSLTGVLYLIAEAKDETVAVSDLKNITERIRATPFNSVVTFFPNGVQDGPGFNLYQTLLGGYNLTNEHITVTYPNVSADPLEIRITVTWQGKYGRSYATGLSTFKTR